MGNHQVTNTASRSHLRTLLALGWSEHNHAYVSSIRVGGCFVSAYYCNRKRPATVAFCSWQMTGNINSTKVFILGIQCMDDQEQGVSAAKNHITPLSQASR